MTLLAHRTESADQQVRRRFLRRQWRRRWLRWRPVLAAVLLLTVLVGTGWLVFFSQVLAVQSVQIRGTGVLTPAQVRSAADVPIGRPLARVDLEAIADRVRTLAPVQDVEVHRIWPDRIGIEVTERTTVAVVEVGGRIRGMDATGVLFRDYRTAPAAVPMVRADLSVATDALAEAATVAASLPAQLARRVDHIEVATIDEITLHLRDNRVVRWGSAERSAVKARVLSALLSRPGRTYDVSVPGQPTVR